MTFAIAAVVDGTILTALGLLVCAALRRRSAALRHLILATSLAAAGAAPLLETTLPDWELPVLSGSAQVTSSVSAFSSVPGSTDSTSDAEMVPAPALTWTAALVAIWAIGFSVVIGGLLAGLVRLVSLTRRCRPVASSLWRARAAVLSQQQELSRAVPVIESPDRAVLLTWGIWRPCIVVPAGAAAWTAERIEIVLAHEIAHIVRRDWALQIATEVVRAVYWFNPVIWIACRRLRDESEQACDDTVLRRGIPAADYASHLLAVARHLLTTGRGSASAPAVANPSTLERRIAAMLNASRNREPLTHTARVVAVLVMLASAIPMAAVTLTEQDPWLPPSSGSKPVAPTVSYDVALAAPEPVESTDVVSASRRTREPVESDFRQTDVVSAFRRTEVAAPEPSPEPQEPATLSGTLRDSTGGVMPGATVTMTDAASRTVSSTISDANGRFLFRSLPPASYEFRASLAGFATVAQEVTLASGEQLQRSVTMPVGGILEAVSVICPVGTALAPRGAAAVFAFGGRPAPTRLFAQQVPVRVGGNIRPPKLIKNAQPACPDTPLANGLVVILEAVIEANGVVKTIKALRPATPDQQQAAFVQSAMNAVRQWEYTPTLLNNVPTPVILTVTVSYQRP